MIKRDNIKRIQQVLMNLLQEDRENYNQNDLHQLVDEINAITENKTFATEKRVTIGSTYYGKKKLFIIVLNSKGKNPMMETPTRDLNEGFRTSSLKQTDASGAPQWFNKLKSTLRK